MNDQGDAKRFVVVLPSQRQLSYFQSAVALTREANG
jgi:hypothetical protein